MHTVSSIIRKLESFALPGLAQFDYVGLLQGDPFQKVKKVGLTLDYSLRAIDATIDAGCQLLITHHGPTSIHYPLIGNQLEKIVRAKNGQLSIYRSHLCLDFCHDGIIAELCRLMQIPAQPVTTQYEGQTITGGVYLAENYPMTFAQLSERIKSLRTNYYRVAGLKKLRFKRIAVTSGKGFISEFFDQLMPEVYIAGEFEQEAVEYARDLGIMLVELSHHASEVRSLENVAATLTDKLEIAVQLIESPESIEIVKLDSH
ncbi:Nif3-like dinuclear metal center hexameric protein [Candidatus Woesebacteria bacterium]|nr:Nif3-like dinuclear metal center hexameric protein [Candidatus Woesebacteria bacterium]